MQKRERDRKAKNENIVGRFDQSRQQGGRNSANIVKERHYFVGYETAAPCAKSGRLANGRGRPPTLNLEAARGVKAAFKGASILFKTPDIVACAICQTENPTPRRYIYVTTD